MKYALIFGLAIILSGCATSAKIDQMVPEDIVAVSPNSLYANAIVIDQVSGGEKTNPLWTSEISSEGFETALRDALTRSGMLSPLRSTGRLNLQVILEEVKQPLFGFSMTVTLTATYRLVRIDGGEILLNEKLVTPYTAKAGDHFLGSERLRLANEGAARESIKAFIELLGSDVLVQT